MRKLTYLLIAVVAFAMTSCGNAQDAKIAELEKEIAELKEKAATMDAAELEKAKTAVVEKMNSVIKEAKEDAAVKGTVEGFKNDLQTIKCNKTVVPATVKGECGDCEKGNGDCCEKGNGDCAECEKKAAEEKECCKEATKTVKVDKDLKVKKAATPVKGKVLEAK